MLDFGNQSIQPDAVRGIGQDTAAAGSRVALVVATFDGQGLLLRKGICLEFGECETAFFHRWKIFCVLQN